MSDPKTPAVPVISEEEAKNKASAIVEQWVQTKLASSEFSSYTPGYNHFTAARADLVARIANALLGK